MLRSLTEVVCLLLYYVSRYVGRQIHYHDYGVETELTGFDYVNCTGTEEYISECDHGIWGVHNCASSTDVAISCFTGQRGITCQLV